MPRDPVKNYQLRSRVPKKKATKSEPKYPQLAHDTVLDQLRKARDKRAFNAVPFLKLGADGICRIETGRMAQRSQQEIYNYAFVVNKYIEKQRGQRVKIKSTTAQRHQQAMYCKAVRAVNKILFEDLNKGKSPADKMSSVVAHVPDECVQVRRFGETHNIVAPTTTSGIGQAPGWMPMTNQANGLVAKIGNQTLNSTGQKDGPYLSKIEVDGLTPECLLSINPVTDALGGTDPYSA